jgi:hypothetical protein
MRSINKRYLNDPMFHQLVDMMEAQVHAGNFAPSEMREAAVLASIHHEERQVRSFGDRLIPKDVKKALQTLEQFCAR